MLTVSQQVTSLSLQVKDVDSTTTDQLKWSLYPLCSGSVRTYELLFFLLQWVNWVGKKKKKTCLFWDERNLLLSSLDKLKNNYTAIDVETYLIRKMWSHTSKSIKNIKIVLIPACNFTTHFPLQQACIGLLLLKNCRSSLHLTSILYYYNATIKDYCWDH